MSSSPRRRKQVRRFHEPGQAHELTFSCYRRWPFLSRDRTRNWFIEALATVCKRQNLELWAYVIMPEHAHVLLFPRDPVCDIDAVLKSIKQPVARKAVNYLRKTSPDWLKRIEVIWPSNRIEHRIWLPGGGYDRNIVHPKAAWMVVDYFHNNPVRRGLVDNPIDWKWSSARWYEGLDGVVLPMGGYPPDPPAR